MFLHPAKRQELFARGQELFNDEQFFEAHEEWEQLWKLEAGADKTFLQGLIQVAAHFVHLKKGNWSGAVGVTKAAQSKLAEKPRQALYLALDLAPLLAALDYNLNVLIGAQLKPDAPPPVPEEFLTPKLFEQ